MVAQRSALATIAVGEEIPPLKKLPTTKQLVQWAVSTNDLNDIHYDKDAALAAKLPGVIVHGRLKAAFLMELVTDWLGREGRLKRLTCNYRGMDLPGSEITCKGKVVEKSVEGQEQIINLEIWIENAKGERTTVGTAEVSIP